MIKLKIEYYYLAALFFLISFSIYFSYTSHIAKAIRNGLLINTLIIGTDAVDAARHSDTLIFSSYDPEKRFLNIISLPRDTHFTPKGYRFRRINEVFAYHYKTKNDEHLASREVCFAVEDLFQNRVTIPYYIQFDYSSFKDFIDKIGGITIDIEDPMHYDDNAGNLHINFEPGRHHLDGQKALEFVRYRSKSGDLGRIVRQQKFLRAVLHRFKNPFVLLKLPNIITTALFDIKTNMTFWDMLTCIIELKDLHSKDILITQLPGNIYKEYWEPDKENCIGLLNTIMPISKKPVSAGPKIRIEVWNASGKQKLAEKVKWLLREKGFDVINCGTSLIRQKKTIINDFTGNLRPAQKISDIISCGDVIIHYNSKRFIDISVLLGEDCNISEVRQ